MSKKALAAGLLLILMHASLALLSCTSKESHLVSCIEDSSIRAEQKDLVALLGARGMSPEAAFTIKSRIASNLEATGNTSVLLAFLDSGASAGGEDPYAAWWLLMAADIYMRQKSPEIAARYFEQILGNCEDLIIRGNSIHRICLQNLIGISSSSERLIQHYTDYIEKFPQDENVPEFCFMLGRSYEQAGEWELALKSYERFLEFERHDIAVSGIPDSYAYARQIVDFNNSSKDWTFASLDELVSGIKEAIDSYSPRALERYRAKVNFFAGSWGQSHADIGAEAPRVEFRIANFMRGNRIAYSSSLDPSSTPNEAYLRTSGWNQYVPVWYFYFRKVNFPADNSIHGRWEWAGIYYGEKI